MLFATRLATKEGDAIHQAIGLAEIEVPKMSWRHLPLPFEAQTRHDDVANPA